MDITPLINADQQVIQAYGEGRFRINGAVYEQAVVVLPSGTHPWGVKGPVAALTLNDFAELLRRKDELDVVLCGSGRMAERPEAELRNALKSAGLNVDYMDTGAACRTYNVLMAEGRRVAAALLPA
jgi:uncharacterized protein